jgi:hypothetical protein
MQKITKKLIEEAKAQTNPEEVTILNVLINLDLYLGGAYHVLTVTQDFIKGDSPYSKEEILERIKEVLKQK